MRYPEDYVNRIIQGDCLEVMKGIPDKSIDMVLCDLPYGTTACSWDTIIPLDLLWEQYKRIIKDNGVIVLTASQPFTSMLVMSNIKMFKYEWIWIKNRASRFLSTKTQPLKKSEDILVFDKMSSYDEEYTDRRRIYFKNILSFIGKSRAQIVSETNQGLDHCFRFGSLQFDMPTKKNYQLLIDLYGIDKMDGFIEYDKNVFNIKYNPLGLRKIKNPKEKGSIKGSNGDVYSLNRKTYKEEFTNYPNNVLYFDCESGLHPTQKPVALFEYLIKTYTNEGDLVLDNCAGSGTTGVACRNTNRNYILIEIEKKYCDIARKRLANVPEKLEEWM